MNINEKDFHNKRRPFIIFPETGLLVGELGTSLSHNDILISIGLDGVRINYIINNYSRGYFMNNDLVFYQGNNFTEGNILEIDNKNISTIKKYIYDFENIFKINEQTNIYLGIKVGKIGDVWPKINQISLTELKSNIK